MSRYAGPCRRPPLARSAGRLGLALLSTLAGCSEEASDDARGTPSGAGCPGLAGETVEWIVPYPPGGGYDVFSRLLEPYVERAVGVEIVVVNRAGAGGIVGARTVRDAEPDGRTLGLVNGTGLLVAGLDEGVRNLHPVDDFTLLGRITVSDPVWVAGPRASRGFLDSLLSEPGPRPVVFGISDVGSVGFISAAVASGLLGLDVEYLAGYPGSREASLGIIRGEMDLGGFTFESIRDRVEAGDLVPVLQISDTPVADDPLLRGVPVLAGEDGLAARSARRIGRDPRPVVAVASALARVFDAGRMVVAPPGLDPQLTRCLRSRLASVAADPAFLASAARARRTVAWASAAEVAADLEATADARRRIGDDLRSHIRRVRGGRP